MGREWDVADQNGAKRDGEGVDIEGRHDTAELRCWTEELRKELNPQPLYVTLKAKFDQEKRPYHKSGGAIAYPVEVQWESPEAKIGSATVRHKIITFAKGRLVPLLLLGPGDPARHANAAVVVLSRADKQTFVRERAAAMAHLLDSGVSVVLPDLYDSGLTGTGMDTARRSSNTGRTSTLAMFGDIG